MRIKQRNEKNNFNEILTRSCCIQLNAPDSSVLYKFVNRLVMSIIRIKKSDLLKKTFFFTEPSLTKNFSFLNEISILTVEVLVLYDIYIS